MNFIKKYPILFSLLLLLIIVIINRIPLNNFIADFGLNKFNSDAIKIITFNCIVIIGVIYILFSNKIPISYIDKIGLRNIIYYLPLIIYLLVFSGGLSNFLDYSFISSNYLKISLYSFKILTSAFLEEILFRGLILGLLLNKYNRTNNGILKSVVISGLLFGSIHIINLWTISDTTFQGVLNQVYAASCLGIMYGAVYLKTRSIIILSILHFFSNFFALIGTLEMATIIETNNIIEKSFLIEFIEEIVRLVIFGIPLFIGLFVIKFTNKKDIDNLMDNVAQQ